jgi:uncharacterized membrane protein YhfC
MKRTVLSLILLLCLLTACSAATANELPNIQKGSYITGHSLNETQAGEFKTGFLVQVPSDGYPIGILLKGQLNNQATLQGEMRNPDGQTLWKSAPLSGRFRFSERIESLPAGEYDLFVTWSDAAQGQFNLYFVPGEDVILPEVSPMILVSGLGMMLVALAYLAYALLRRLHWGYLGLGALAWIVTVAIKFAIAIPLNPLIYNWLLGNTFPQPWGEGLFHLYVGSLTGWTEVLLCWLVLRYTRLGQADWKKALGFGLGFGTVEALLLGLASFGSSLVALLAPAQIPAETFAALVQNSNLGWSLAPIVERLFVVIVHLFCCVLLFYAAALRRPGFFWLSFAFKSLMDSIASYAQLHGLTTLTAVWTVEGLIAVFGVLALFGLRWLAQRYPAPAPNPTSETVI